MSDDLATRRANRERVLAGIPKDWRTALRNELAGDSFGRLADWLVDEWTRPGTVVYPAERQVFRALELTPLGDVRAVIVGQDPYYTEGLATGLAFSIPDGYDQPRSLQNILRAREYDLGIPVPNTGSLAQWAGNGVLLLNTALTVRHGKANSHGKYWRSFTGAVIRAAAAQPRPILFLLWGRHAQRMEPLVGGNRVVTSCHPAARGVHPRFIDSAPFSDGDATLRSLNIWSLPGDSSSRKSGGQAIKGAME